MTMYRYEGLDSEGAPVSGTMEETSARRVVRRLQERGLSVNKVEEMHADKRPLQVSKRLTWEELEIFTNQLHALAASGLPMPEALRAMARDVRSPRLRPLLESVGKGLERGDSLDAVLEENHQHLPRIFPAMARAGESSGNMAAVLERLSTYSHHMVNLRNSIQISFAYPAIVLLFAMGIIAFLFTKVVPVFQEIFTEFGGALPAPTRLLIGMSESFRRQWPIWVIELMIVFILLFVVYRQIRRFPKGRLMLDWCALHLPLLGRAIYLGAVARFAQTLALLLRSNVSVLDALELAAAASGSETLMRAVENASLAVASGEKISAALRDTNFFGAHFCWMLATSEDRGEVERALENLAEAHERSVSYQERSILSILPTAIIVCTAMVIGFLVVSLYLPLFTLGDAISG